MRTATEWLNEMSPENNYGKPSISRLDYIERIQHDVQDDFTKQVADLKDENARLAAACIVKDAALRHWQKHMQASIPRNADEQEAAGEDFTDVWFETQRALRQTGTALRDLLGPTVELLQRVKDNPYSVSRAHLESELARLRAAREGGK